MKSEKNYCSRGVTAALLETQQDSRIRQIQTHVQNVIELMGPNTPNFGSDSHEANEDSCVSSASITSSRIQVRKFCIPCNETANSTRETSPRDFSFSSSVAASQLQDFDDVKVKQQPQVPKCEYACNQATCPHASALRYLQQLSSFHTCAATTKESQSKSNNTIKRLFDKFGRSCKLPSYNNCPAMVVQDLYKMDVCPPPIEIAPPKRLVFDLVQEIPQPNNNVQDVATNTEKLKKNVLKSDPHVKTDYGEKVQKPATISKSAKVQVYYFDHGNAAYFQTTDPNPSMFAEVLTEKTERYTTKFWAEVFGTIYIGFAFVTSFILQLLKFILYGTVRPLLVGTVQTFGDYFLKPCLAVFFNAIIQPPMIFLYNIATSVRDLCDPCAQGIGYFFREIAVMMRACRLFTVTNNQGILSERKKLQDVACECNEEEIRDIRMENV